MIPNKTTPTDYEIIDLIKERWSPRVFSEEIPKEEDVKRLFEAGRWAPSSNNFQPWVIIYGIKGTPMYDRIYNCLVEFNQGWAKHAPVLALGAFKKDMPNGEKENFHALHDLGAFSMAIFLFSPIEIGPVLNNLVFFKIGIFLLI